MTRAEALAEARRRGLESVARTAAAAEAVKRWGLYGYAGKLVEPAEMAENEEPIVMYWVGIVNDDADDFYSVEKGSGDSWEAAFADADRRAK